MRFQLRRAIVLAGLAALVASGAAPADDPDVLFARIKAHISEHLAHLPDYTCHEHIDRSLRMGSNWQAVDTVDLEVAFAGDRELFARPGSTSFGEEPVEKLVSGGTISNSALGSHIDIIMSRDAAEFQYAGTGKKDGHKTLRYNLVVPVERSRFLVRHSGAEGMAGYEGSVWVDAETYDLVRVDFKINRIPPHVGVRLIEESLHYKTMSIGKSDFDLPEHSELSATDDRGNYSLDLIKLSRCHEFTSDSVVKYAPPSEGTAARETQDH